MGRFKTLVYAVFLTLPAGATMAERVNIASNATVQISVERLTDAVQRAGARVFATVDFAKGAASVGQSLRPTTVVVFGSPKIGATALLQGQTMALYLPLRILFFEDANGQTWATYDDPSGVAPSHGLAADDKAVLRMQDALENFSSIAAGD